MFLLSGISMADVFEHYAMRLSIHERMVDLLHRRTAKAFAQLALGITNPRANYSAYEHGLGRKILARHGRAESVLSLGVGLLNCGKASGVPAIIMRHNIPYLKISVGSEIGMLLRPNDFWVANVRTVWAYLLVKHAYDFDLANEELELYRDGERSSEMNYEIWGELHRLLETSQIHLHDLGLREARRQGAAVGDKRFLWADAIANAIYKRRESYRLAPA